MSKTQGHKLDITITVRLEPRDFARILLFYKEQGRVFKDRASMLREVYQDFCREHKVIELTTEEAQQILSEEYYIRTPQQKLVEKIRNRFDNAKMDEARKLIDSQGVDINEAFENLPIEPSAQEKKESS